MTYPGELSEHGQTMLQTRFVAETRVLGTGLRCWTLRLQRLVMLSMLHADKQASAVSDQHLVLSSPDALCSQHILAHLLPAPVDHQLVLQVSVQGAEALLCT